MARYFREALALGYSPGWAFIYALSHLIGRLQAAIA